MADTCTCTCSQIETRRIIFACSGASNVGELSNAAAVALTAEGFGSKACTASLAIITPSVMKKVGDADEIVVIDGCPVECTGKIAAEAGIEPDQHIVITDLGIEKIGDMTVDEDDLETVVSAAWEGQGRKMPAPERKKPGTGGCGCGCGGGC
ncbi:putative zinc-binding protein [Methanofollis fontis]|uniref:Zinc-binding protein n=1 Tax=Methanofollis fontis TaxID=2052832 RepID=A0A483CX48_9EURY|nr:putative zinc-binding protein [Methanofollis fontis]TAJ44306.1 zinc-binding protein [Methanofollis fontis]